MRHDCTFARKFCQFPGNTRLSVFKFSWLQSLLELLFFESLHARQLTIDMWSSKLDTSVTSEGGFFDASKAEDSNERRAQTLIPTVIKNLLTASSTEDVTLWGIPARMFAICGIVRNIEETPTKISYEVEDQTGTIAALKWLEASRKTTEPGIQCNTYVRVGGVLREQNDKRHLLIIRISPLQRITEITTHLLEVTYATLKAKASADLNPAGGAKERDSLMIETNNESSPYYGMSPDQSLVYKIIHAQNDTESGIERKDIKAKVPRIDASDVDEILEFLVSEGHIYTTSTDDHFKTT